MGKTTQGIKVKKGDNTEEFDYEEMGFLYLGLTKDYGHFDQGEYDRIRPKLKEVET